MGYNLKIAVHNSCFPETADTEHNVLYSLLLAEWSQTSHAAFLMRMCWNGGCWGGGGGGLVPNNTSVQFRLVSTS